MNTCYVPDFNCCHSNTFPIFAGYRSPSSFSAVGQDTYGQHHPMYGGHNHHGRSGRHSSLGLTPYGSAAAMAAAAASVQGYKEMRRTPSTSAIYETLRRSKELRESINSRPSSRLSLRGDNVRKTYSCDKRRQKHFLGKFQDTNYFSDSEHQMMSSGSYSQRQEMRRIRNRTMSGLDVLQSGAALPGVVAGGGINSGMLSDGGGSRPGSRSSDRRPITPSFHNEKDGNGQQFVDFNPAGQFLIRTAYRALHKMT